MEPGHDEPRREALLRAVGGAEIPAPGGAAPASRSGWDAGAAHLLDCGDGVISALVRRIGPLDEEDRSRGRPEDPYGALVRTVLGQQLSVRAARSIYGRLCARFGGRPPLPGELEAVPDEDLRACGVSAAKIRCLRDLARRVLEGSLPLGELERLPDGEVILRLTAVRGIGRWSADMFLIFHLRRPDVLPVGDLGIRRAAAGLYGLSGLPGPEVLHRLAAPWRPWRTTACLYLWRSLDALPA